MTLRSRSVSWTIQITESLSACQSIFLINQSSHKPQLTPHLCTKAIQHKVCARLFKEPTLLLLLIIRAKWSNNLPISAFNSQKINGNIVRATTCSKNLQATRQILTIRSLLKKVTLVNFLNSLILTRQESFPSTRSAFSFSTLRMPLVTRLHLKWFENCQRCFWCPTWKLLTSTSSPSSSWASSQRKPFRTWTKSHFVCHKFLAPFNSTTQSKNCLRQLLNRLKGQ